MMRLWRMQKLKVRVKETCNKKMEVVAKAATSFLLKVLFDLKKIVEGLTLMSLS